MAEETPTLKWESFINDGYNPNIGVSSSSPLIKTVLITKEDSKFVQISFKEHILATIDLVVLDGIRPHDNVLNLIVHDMNNVPIAPLIDVLENEYLDRVEQSYMQSLIQFGY